MSQAQEKGMNRAGGEIEQKISGNGLVLARLRDPFSRLGAPLDIDPFLFRPNYPALSLPFEPTAVGIYYFSAAGIPRVNLYNVYDNRPVLHLIFGTSLLELQTSPFVAELAYVPFIVPTSTEEKHLAYDTASDQEFLKIMIQHTTTNARSFPSMEVSIRAMLQGQMLSLSGIKLVNDIIAKSSRVRVDPLPYIVAWPGFQTIVSMPVLYKSCTDKESSEILLTADNVFLKDYHREFEIVTRVWFELFMSNVSFRDRMSSPIRTRPLQRLGSILTDAKEAIDLEALIVNFNQAVSRSNIPHITMDNNHLNVTMSNNVTHCSGVEVSDRELVSFNRPDSSKSFRTVFNGNQNVISTPAWLLTNGDDVIQATDTQLADLLLYLDGLRNPSDPVNHRFAMLQNRIVAELARRADNL